MANHQEIKKRSDRSWLLALAGLLIIVVLAAVIALCAPHQKAT